MLPSQEECFFAFGPILSVDLACYHRQKSFKWLGEGRNTNLDCSALVKQRMIKLHAFPSIFRFHTLLASPAVINSMLSSCWFHATKADMVFFGDLDMLVHTECSEIRACIWPMRQVFAVPAFVPLLVGSVDLKYIN